MKAKAIYLLLLFLFATHLIQAQTEQDTGSYERLTSNLAKGWNTWNTRSVLSYVLLPQCYAVDLMIQDGKTGKILNEALIGRRGEGAEIVKPGSHAYDGSYTGQTVLWGNIQIKVQSAWEGDKFAIKVTPLNQNKDAVLLIQPHVLWEKKGTVQISSSGFSFKQHKSNVDLYLSASGKAVLNDSLIRCPLSGDILISTIKSASSKEIDALIARAERKQLDEIKKYAPDNSLYEALQTVLAWDIIYEPTHKRVIAPVSRIWSCNWGGWVLFDWDTYFASLMFAMENKELAYSNAIAITNEITTNGFIPNFGAGICKSEDRSQPPVGSYVTWKIYQCYHEKWFLEEVFDKLLTWNRWWEKNRDVNGYLCWGSDTYDASTIPQWLSKEVGKKQAAMWESGLDNSPMYDDAVFDPESHKLMLADVGLLSMYIWDCKSLSLIAKELGKNEIKAELDKRIEKYSKSLETLWDEKTGIYLNKDLSTSKFSQRLSPTLFYPLLTGVPSQAKAERMINDHYFNPDEFWGEWIMPSISRNDIGFKDNTYWRGRVWAPMNFLVYTGMLNYDLPKAKTDLAEKSANLLLKSWLTERHIYENYNAVTGMGDDVENSDKFYHWGALLAYISLIENKKLILSPSNQQMDQR